MDLQAGGTDSLQRFDGLPRELVLAILLVVIIGLGPVASALALAIGSVGLPGKLVADFLEEIDPGPLPRLLFSPPLRASSSSSIAICCNPD